MAARSTGNRRVIWAGRKLILKKCTMYDVVKNIHVQIPTSITACSPRNMMGGEATFLLLCVIVPVRVAVNTTCKFQPPDSTG